MSGWTDCWIKYFADGTCEQGTDKDVFVKKASWQKGRLDSMVGAEVYYNDKRIAIMIPGKFWQSDDYEVNILDSKPKLLTRRLQKQIKHDDALQFKENECALTFTINKDNPTPGLQYINKWLTLEINVVTGLMTWRIEESKI